MSRFPTRKGYRAIAVDFRDGTPRVTQWEKVGKPEPDHIPDAQQKVRPARGALAAERQATLFPD